MGRALVCLNLWARPRDIYGTDSFHGFGGLDECGNFLHFKHKISMENVRKNNQYLHMISNIYIRGWQENGKHTQS